MLCRFCNSEMYMDRDSELGRQERVCRGCEQAIRLMMAKMLIETKEAAHPLVGLIGQAAGQ